MIGYNIIVSKIQGELLRMARKQKTKKDDSNEKITAALQELLGDKFERWGQLFLERLEQRLDELAVSQAAGEYEDNPYFDDYEDEDEADNYEDLTGCKIQIKAPTCAWFHQDTFMWSYFRTHPVDKCEFRYTLNKGEIVEILEECRNYDGNGGSGFLVKTEDGKICAVSEYEDKFKIIYN